MMVVGPECDPLITPMVLEMVLCRSVLHQNGELRRVRSRFRSQCHYKDKVIPHELIFPWLTNLLPEEGWLQILAKAMRLEQNFY